jgi:hypothetical protein
MQWPAIEAEPSPRMESRQKEGLEFHRLVHQHLLGIAPEELDRAASSAHVRSWWANYRAANLDLQGWDLRSELTLHAMIGPHRLVAKYDLIACRDGRAVIYDWKTWAHRPSNEWLETRWQTRVYRALLVKGGAVLNEGHPFHPEDVGMIYWFAELPEEPAIFSYDSPRFRSDWAAIQALTAEVTDQQTFPMTDDRRKCRFCVFRSYCDRGERASEWQAPGDEASAEPDQDVSLFELGESTV